MTTFDTLAAYYAAGRIGYSSELYSTLFQYGLNARLHVLDVGCGTGLASKFLIENGFRVTGVDVSAPMLAAARKSYPSATWVEGSAEALPFEPATFDAAIAAQTFHHLDRQRAIEELKRVLKPGGLVAIWWKHVMSGDPVGHVRDQVARACGAEAAPSGLPGGFKEFYAAGLFDPQVRVLPWHVTVSLDEYLNYERSRKVVRDTLGARAERYFEELERRLRDMLGERPHLPLSYVQYLYLARKPLK